MHTISLLSWYSNHNLFLQIQVKTRRKLSLDRDQNTKMINKSAQKEETELRDSKQQAKHSNAEDNMPPQNNMTDLEKALAEPTAENYQEMLDLSLNNDEMRQLLDDISWSPMDIKTSKKKQQHAGISPAKQYVRSKSTELNSLAGNIAVQDIEISHRNAGLCLSHYFSCFSVSHSWYIFAFYTANSKKVVLCKP